MKKGFTLIELLAVIVILAVIAIIATPIILNIIEDARKNSAKSSAELYVDGLSKQIMSKNMTGLFNPSSCTISNGNVTCGGVALDYKTNGKKPTSGSITLNNGIITGYTLYFDDYTVTKNQNGVSIAEGSSQAPFTGTIYRVSNEIAINGESIIPRDATVACMHDEINENLSYNYCDEGLYYNTIEECNTAINNGWDPARTTCVMETVQFGVTDYQTESPLTTPITKNVYCYTDNGINSCIDGNLGTINYEVCASDAFACVSGTIQPNHYLKHEVVNNIIQSSYACIKYTEGGVVKEACVRGGDPSYYGTYDGMTSEQWLHDISDKNPTGNFAILSALNFGNTITTPPTTTPPAAGQGWCNFETHAQCGRYSTATTLSTIYSDPQYTSVGVESDWYYDNADFVTGCYISSDGQSACY